MSNIDFNELMKMLSNIDKKELENRMNQVSNMLKDRTPEEQKKFAAEEKEKRKGWQGRRNN